MAAIQKSMGCPTWYIWMEARQTEKRGGGQSVVMKNREAAAMALLVPRRISMTAIVFLAPVWIASIFAPFLLLGRRCDKAEV
jgi:hypothetical protein